MVDNLDRFLIIDDIFSRYIVYVDIIKQTTLAYCEECDQWVFEVDGDHLSTKTQLELFEYIVEQHDEQKHGVLVEFDEWSETFL